MPGALVYIYQGSLAAVDLLHCWYFEGSLPLTICIHDGEKLKRM